MEVRYIEAAIHDVKEAVEYLRERSPLTAARSEFELGTAVTKLRTHPYFGFPIGGEFRKVGLRTLPWSLVYRVDPSADTLWIVVVRHRLRHPSHGIDRKLPGGQT